MVFDEVLKYKAPVTKESPSLSVDGSEAFAPKYLSSKLSKDAAAFVAEVDASLAFVVAVEADEAADVAELAALVAELAAAVALLAAAVALEAAAEADVVALAASTNKSHFAESVFVVNGCDPEDVCAVLAIKILFVEVSLTISLT